MLDTSYLHTDHVTWLQGIIQKTKTEATEAETKFMDRFRLKMYRATNPKYYKSNYEAWNDISDVNDHYYFTDETLAAVFALELVEFGLTAGGLRNYFSTIEERLSSFFDLLDEEYLRINCFDDTFCHDGAINCAQQIVENTDLFPQTKVFAPKYIFPSIN